MIKAKVRKTGEIIEAACYGIIGSHYMYCDCDSDHLYKEDELEPLPKEKNIDNTINLEQRRYEIAKSIYPYFLANAIGSKFMDEVNPALDAIKYAQKLLDELEKIK